MGIQTSSAAPWDMVSCPTTADGATDTTRRLHFIAMCQRYCIVLKRAELSLRLAPELMPQICTSSMRLESFVNSSHSRRARARRALNLLLVPPAAGHKGESPTAAVQFFDQLEIYPGKRTNLTLTILWPHCELFRVEAQALQGT